jgi:hypothetical protein
MLSNQFSRTNVFKRIFNDLKIMIHRVAISDFNTAYYYYYYYYSSISACSPRAGTNNIYVCAPL